MFVLTIPLAAWFAPFLFDTHGKAANSIAAQLEKATPAAVHNPHDIAAGTAQTGADDTFLDSTTASKINSLFCLAALKSSGSELILTRPEAQPAVAEEARTKMPSLKLKGTLFGSPSYAVLESRETKDASEWLAMEGMTIRGWKITSIDSDRVFIEKDDRRVTLSLFGGKSDMIQKDTIEISRSRILEQVMKLGEVMSKIHVAPYIINRELRGFKLPKIDSPFLREMGLEDGDVVLEVDGRRIEGVESAWALAGTMASKNDVVVRIKRNGRDRVLKYALGL